MMMMNDVSWRTNVLIALFQEYFEEDFLVAFMLVKLIVFFSIHFIYNINFTLMLKGRTKGVRLEQMQ